MQTNDNIVEFKQRGPVTIFQAFVALKTEQVKLVEHTINYYEEEDISHPDSFELGMVWNNALEWCVTGTRKKTKEDAIASAMERVKAFKAIGK